MKDPGPPPMTARRSRRPSISISGFNAMPLLLCQIVSNRFYHQFMIFFLRQPRYCDCAYDARIFYDNRKATAMRSILTFGDQVGLFDGFPLAFEQLPHIKGTVPESIGQPHFALHPLIIIWRCAAQAGMKKLVSSPHDIHCDGKVPAARQFHQLTAKVPCDVLIEYRELKFLFLLQ